MDSTPRLRVVEATPTGEPVEAPDRATEEYWSRVQQLRADLARLRPAN